MSFDLFLKPYKSVTFDAVAALVRARGAVERVRDVMLLVVALDDFMMRLIIGVMKLMTCILKLQLMLFAGVYLFRATNGGGRWRRSTFVAFGMVVVMMMMMVMMMMYKQDDHVCNYECHRCHSSKIPKLKFRGGLD